MVDNKEVNSVDTNACGNTDCIGDVVFTVEYSMCSPRLSLRLDECGHGLYIVLSDSDLNVNVFDKNISWDWIDQWSCLLWVS